MTDGNPVMLEGFGACSVSYDSSHPLLLSLPLHSIHLLLK